MKIFKGPPTHAKTDTLKQQADKQAARKQAKLDRSLPTGAHRGPTVAEKFTKFINIRLPETLREKLVAPSLWGFIVGLPFNLAINAVKHRAEQNVEGLHRVRAERNAHPERHRKDISNTLGPYQPPFNSPEFAVAHAQVCAELSAPAAGQHRQDVYDPPAPGHCHL